MSETNGHTAAPFDWLAPTQQEGWDAINALAPGADVDPAAAAFSAALARYNDAKLVATVFMEGRGPELLERWRVQLFEQPLVKLTGTVGITEEMEISLTPEQWAFVREGQNSVLRYVMRSINEAMAGPPLAEPKAPPQQAEG